MFAVTLFNAPANSICVFKHFLLSWAPVEMITVIIVIIVITAIIAIMTIKMVLTIMTIEMT